MSARTAHEQGELWGTRARDWAEHELETVPIKEALLGLLDVGRGTRLLDAGCGAGTCLHLAHERGAEVHGLDASEALLAIAADRAPAAELRLGDLEDLPYGDDAFDVVTGFNAFQFARDMVAALREAARVTRPGGLVGIQVWGLPERCDLAALVGALRPLVPRSAPAPVLAAPGVLPGIVREAGLEPVRDGVVRCAFAWPDAEAMLRSVLSAGLPVLAMRAAGEEAVRRAALEGLAPFRVADGSYRVENDWHYLVAAA
jgi:SAM-dependent methyltransferase